MRPGDLVITFGLDEDLKTFIPALVEMIIEFSEDVKSLTFMSMEVFNDGRFFGSFPFQRQTMMKDSLLAFDYSIIVRDGRIVFRGKDSPKRIVLKKTRSQNVAV